MFNFNMTWNQLFYGDVRSWNCIIILPPPSLIALQLYAYWRWWKWRWNFYFFWNYLVNIIIDQYLLPKTYPKHINLKRSSQALKLHWWLKLQPTHCNALYDRLMWVKCRATSVTKIQWPWSKCNSWKIYLKLATSIKFLSNSFWSKILKMLNILVVKHLHSAP